MISGRLNSRRQVSSTARRTLRELLLCVALPSILLVSFNVVAQKADSSQPHSDEQIAAEIHNQIEASDALRSLNIGVWVNGGKATLSGTVPTPELRQQAASLVQSVPGITSVDDEIAIGQQPAVSSPAAQQGPGTPPPPPNQAEQNGQGNYPPPPQQNGPPPQGYGQNNGPPPRSYPAPGQQRMVTVPAGTPITVMMLRTIDSHHTKPGKPFRGVVVRDVILMNGATAIPRGAYVEGTIIDSRGPGHLKGHPHLALQLDHLDMGDQSYQLMSLVWSRRGPGKGGQTTGNVVGSSAAGAIIGGAVGGGPTALLGAVLGGLGGAGLSAASRGPQLFIPAESVLTFTTSEPVVVREPTLNEIRSLAGNVPIRDYYGPPGSPQYPGAYPPQPPPGPPGGYPY